MKKRNNFFGLALFWVLFLLTGSLTVQAQNQSLHQRASFSAKIANPGAAFNAKVADHRNQIRKQSEYEQKIREYKPAFPPLGSDGARLKPFGVYREALKRSGAESIVPSGRCIARQSG